MRTTCDRPANYARTGSNLTAMAMLTYVVEDISCGHCKAAIEGGVRQVPGVQRVEVDVESKRVVVEGDASDDAVVAAIVEAGYDKVERQ